MSIRIIPIGSTDEPHLSPDILFDGAMGDFAIADNKEPQNRGGLAAANALKTAVVLCLMTDVRAQPEELRTGDINRGWPGDSFDVDRAVGEAPLGSKLWLLMRSTVDDVERPRMAEDYAREALQPLLDQQAVARIDVDAVGTPARNRLELNIRLTDRDGTLRVTERFSVLWGDL